MEVLTTKEIDIEVNKLKKGAMLLRAINHKLRQQILQLIHKKGRMTVTEIYVKLRLEQSVTSQHLAILRRANFVVTERDGKYIFYSVNYQQLKHVHHTVDKLLSK